MLAKPPGPDKALVVAVGAVFRSDRILLIRRNFEPFAGCWGMPGGKIHAGEHIEDAVEREVFEECGIRAEFQRFCGVLSERVSLGARTGTKGTRCGIVSPTCRHYLVLVSRLKALTEEITPSCEGDVRWFPKADLGKLKRVMIPSDYLMLERFVFRPSRRVYYRCEIVKLRGRYRILKFY